MLFQLTHIDPQTQIGIWQIEEPESQLHQLYRPNTDEQNELQTFKNENRRKGYLAARLALKHCVGGDFVLKKQDFSKPYLAHRSDVEISLTHTKGFAAAIINANTQKVGIDLEWVRPKIGDLKNKFLSQDEQLLLKKMLANDNELYVLTQAWSAKEAVYKCYGQRQLDFKKNMQVVAFSNNSCTIYLNTVNLSKNIDICMQNPVEGLVLVWCIEPKDPCFET